MHVSSAIFVISTPNSLGHNVVFVSRDIFAPSLSLQGFGHGETRFGDDLIGSREDQDSQRTFEQEKDQVTAAQNTLVLSTVHALARRQNHLLRSTYLQGLLEVNSCRRCWCFITTLNGRTSQNLFPVAES